MAGANRRWYWIRPSDGESRSSTEVVSAEAKVSVMSAKAPRKIGQRSRRTRPMTSPTSESQTSGGGTFAKTLPRQSPRAMSGNERNGSP